MAAREEGKTHVGYKHLGRSGLQVSRVILGMMTYGNKRWEEWVLGQEECNEHVQKAWEHGINTFDTADIYSQGGSEVMLGKAVKTLNTPRDTYVILTKCGFPVKAGSVSGGMPPLDDPDGKGYVNQRGLSRKHIFDAVQASLRRLDTPYIDVLQCHRFDYETPIEETMRALHDVVQKGWVRYVGMSSCHVHQLWAMQTYAIQHNLTPFISMQNYVNAAYREEEREMVPTLKHFGVGCIPWSPIARGFLARPLDATHNTVRGGGADKTFTLVTDLEAKASREINKRVEEVAKQTGFTMAQVSFAWVMAQDYVTAPIVGATKLNHLIEAIESVNLKLTPEQIRYINEPYIPQTVKGHW